ncbi:hypothetical protein BDQ12DRAFT_713301 [Crucibulum laeve]|uniref:Nephrocystin 3-like N-terminal domain-containing protein n=1 Tax=Crucibulum laeve TaxID=68775 RepID=A0A5C3LXI9_9AGAR|nr:hypothetical protein BDQ12DRAFT_713301 [Crucibulum laeve]
MSGSGVLPGANNVTIRDSNLYNYDSPRNTDKIEEGLRKLKDNAVVDRGHRWNIRPSYSWLNFQHIDLFALEARVCVLESDLCEDTSAAVEHLCSTLAEHGKEWIHFAYSKGDPYKNEINKVIFSVASQIADIFPVSRGYIGRAIAADRHIFEKSPTEQLQRLIIAPLQLMKKYLEDNLTPARVIIENLDQCGDIDNQLDILEMISKIVVQHNLPLSFIVTTRPNAHINEYIRIGCLRDVTHFIDLQPPCPEVDMG